MHKTEDNVFPSVSTIKKKLFFRFEGIRTVGRRRQALDHGSTWYLQDRHLHLLALPDTERVGRGLSLCCWDRASIVARADFIAACSRWKNIEKANIFVFFPTTAVWGYFRLFLKAIFLKKPFWTSRFHWHRFHIRLVFIALPSCSIPPYR